LKDFPLLSVPCNPEEFAMPGLLPVDSLDAIPAQYQDTPIARLLEYHNLQRPFDQYSSAEMLIGMCMDNRKTLRIPDNFAYILRTGGANLRYSKFQVAYAVALARSKAIALIGHNNCGMAGLTSRRQAFVDGLVEHAGWDRQRAEIHFMNYASFFEIEDEVEFVVEEVQRMRDRYPTLVIAPLMYRVEDNLLYLVDE
jgi:carbonic anhydrase